MTETQPFETVAFTELEDGSIIPTALLIEEALAAGMSQAQVPDEDLPTEFFTQGAEGNSENEEIAFTAEIGDLDDYDIDFSESSPILSRRKIIGVLDVIHTTIVDPT